MIKNDLSNGVLLSIFIFIALISGFIGSYNYKIYVDKLEIRSEVNEVRTNQTEYDYTDDNISGTFYIDMNNITGPTIFDNIFKDPSDTSIRGYNLKIDREMDIVSKFIKHKNYKTPKTLGDIISYHIINNCKKTKMPTGLIVGIIKVESFFDPSAISKKRAKGLMQVLDKECEGEKIDHTRLYNIDYNISTGIKILKSKLKSTNGDLNKALFKYVGGDKEYAKDVFKVMGEFVFFRSQLL